MFSMHCLKPQFIFAANPLLFKLTISCIKYFCMEEKHNTFYTPNEF